MTVWSKHWVGGVHFAWYSEDGRWRFNPEWWRVQGLEVPAWV